MEVLEVKAPSQAERRVIYYSCECRVHASRFETSSVLPFCPWRRVSRMKRLWDVIVAGWGGGDGFLRPQLRDGCCVFQRRHSGVFPCSYNTTCTEVENCATVTQERCHALAQTHVNPTVFRQARRGPNSDYITLGISKSAICTI